MAHKYSHGWMADTQPAALRAFLDLNHNLPAQQKYDQVVAMYESINATYAVEERRLHPDADDREIFLRVAARRLGPELVRKAYGWAPDE
jgi:hypothetical protein